MKNKNLIKRNRRRWYRRKNKYFKKSKIFIRKKKNLWRDIFVKNYDLAKLKDHLLRKPRKRIFNKLKKKFINIYKRFKRLFGVV